MAGLELSWGRVWVGVPSGCDIACFTTNLLVTFPVLSFLWHGNWVIRLSSGNMRFLKFIIAWVGFCWKHCVVEWVLLFLHRVQSCNNPTGPVYYVLIVSLTPHWSTDWNWCWKKKKDFSCSFFHPHVLKKRVKDSVVPVSQWMTQWSISLPVWDESGNSLLKYTFFCQLGRL